MCFCACQRVCTAGQKLNTLKSMQLMNAGKEGAVAQAKGGTTAFSVTVNTFKFKNRDLRYWFGKVG